MAARKPHRRARRGRSRLIAFGLAVAAAAIAGYVWRSMQPPAVKARSPQANAGRALPRASGDAGAEDFSASERQGLEDVLKRRSMGKQP